jgi:subfamily B ATP-binding cassette protein HlyB/CyaB
MDDYIGVMANPIDEEVRPPSALVCLCFAARARQVHADPEHLVHSLGQHSDILSAEDIQAAARAIGLHAQQVPSDWERLLRVPLPLPLLARMHDGRFVVLTRLEELNVEIYDPEHSPQPILRSRQAFEQDWAGQLVLIRKREEKKVEGKPFGLSWFVPFLSKYRRVLLQVMLATFFIQLLGLVTPMLTGVIIDKVVTNKSTSTLHVLGVGLLLVIVFDAILCRLRDHLTVHTASRIDVGIGTRVFKHLARLPLRYFEERRVGDTLTRMQELDTIRRFMVGTAVKSALDLLFVIIYLAVMFMVSPTLTWIIVVSIPITLCFPLILRPLMAAREREHFLRRTDRHSALVQAISGIHTIKALALEPLQERKWGATVAATATASFRQEEVRALVTTANQVVSQLGVLAVLWIGALQVVDGAITVGQLIAFQMLANRAVQPLGRIANTWQDLQQVSLSVTNLAEIMDEKPEPASAPGKAGHERIKGGVSFRSVQFRYNSNGPLTLNKLSFDVTPGQTVGIVGRSGSGKSTLAKLLQGMYSPESGQIMFDGIEMERIDVASLRRQIGIVLQENFLFSGTIRENISIHSPESSLEDVIEAAQVAAAHDFIRQLPDGYDTQVGERGVSLSGGQRQRLAIARAVLTNPRVLIFDEATSALDYETERLIQRNLIRLCAGRTVFMIAHRLSTIQHADQILMLEDGAVIESGTHAELMIRHGAYYHLFAQQEMLGHDHETA